MQLHHAEGSCVVVSSCYAPRVRSCGPSNLAASLVTVLAGSLVACGGDEPSALDAGTVIVGADARPGADVASDRDSEPTAPGPDPSDVLFTRDRLLRVELELAAADWDALRAQTRTLESTLAREACLDEPFVSPFTYFPARLRIDGVEYPRVGLRKKGFLGSLSEAKPSLKIKLDEYTEDLAHLGLEKLAFNNGQQDPTQIKPCIGLDQMRAAGVATPRCGYAEVIVNGTSLGAYVHVEDVGKRFLRLNFGEDEGHLYEGTVSDFRAGWTGTFEQEVDTERPYDRSELEALRAALESPDDRLLAALEPLLDLDAFLRFWSTEALIEHWDGYSGNTNNFYLYRRTDGRVEFIPWGVDGILGSRHQPPFSVYAESLLARRLYFHPQVRPRYLEALEARLDEWDSAAILAQIDEAAATVAPAIPVAQRAISTAATEALRGFVRGRAAELRDELAAGGGQWLTPLRDRLCFRSGRLTATLATRFGTHPAADIFSTGTGTYTATITGAAGRGIFVGSSAGMGTNPDDMNDAVLVQAATLPDGSIPVVYLIVRPSLLVDGTTLPIDGAAVRGALFRFPRAGAPLEVVAFMTGGTVTIRRAAATPLAPIDVSVEAELLVQRP